MIVRPSAAVAASKQSRGKLRIRSGVAFVEEKTSSAGARGAASDHAVASGGTGVGVKQVPTLTRTSAPQAHALSHCRARRGT